MFRRLSLAVVSLICLPQVAFAQSDAARAAANAFDGPDQPPAQPLPAPVGDAPASIQIDQPENGELLIAGPLHEAYAEQFTSEPTPGLIVPKEPPAPIDEIPPDYRPDGSNVVWVPGYWGWDVDRDDFVWVTGIWRQAPPDRNWVPGYWAQTRDGYQWISGFWAPVEAEEVVYLPEPPAPVEAQPSSEAPSENHFWIPGQWVWIDNDYQWRAGYWAAGYPDWVWVPERYVWTPAGYIFRPGYWDYLLVDRGTIFCPVVWNTRVVTTRFQPTYVVNTGPALLANLFVYPRYHHYYFGNYYSSRYIGQTLYPWATFTQQSRLYDPLYGYYRTQYRDAAYLQRITRMVTYFSANPNIQAPRTLAAQVQSRVANANVNNTTLNNTVINNNLTQMFVQATTLQNLAKDNDAPFQLVQLQSQERQRLESALDPVRKLRQERAQAERADAANNVARAGAEGQQKARGGKAGNRWRLPKNQAGTGIGAVAVSDQAGARASVNANGTTANNASANNADTNRTDTAAAGDKTNNNAKPNDNARDTARNDDARDRARGDDRRDRPRDDAMRDTARSDAARDDAPNATSANAAQNAAAENARDALGRDAAGRNVPGRDAAGRDALGRDAASRDALGRDAAGRDAAGRDAAGRDNGGRGAANSVPRPQTDDARDRARTDAGRDAARGDGLRDANPNSSGDMRPGNALPRNTLPGNLAPGNNTPGNNTPGNNPLDRTKPGDAGRAANPPAADNLNNRAPSNRGRAGATPDRTQTGAPDAGSIQADMEAMREFSRREAQRRRSSAPDVRKLPERPQPAGAGAPAPRPQESRSLSPGNRGAKGPGAGNPAAGGRGPGGNGPGVQAPAGNAGGKGPGGNAGGKGPGNNPGKGKDKGKDK